MTKYVIEALGNMHTGVRPFVKLARNPLNCKFFECEDTGAHEEGKKQFTEEAGDLFVVACCARALTGVNQRLERDPTSKCPAGECYVSEKGDKYLCTTL